MESMRKDVECVFGILKARFRILKYGMRFRNVNTVNDVFHTCCALHNQLLRHDGFTENMRAGAIPDHIHNGDFAPDLEYEVDDCDSDDDDDYAQVAIPAIGAIELEDDEEDNDDDSELAIPPNSLDANHFSYSEFGELLRAHFKRAWSKKEVKWPSYSKHGHEGHDNDGNGDALIE